MHTNLFRIKSFEKEKLFSAITVKNYMFKNTAEI